MRLRVTKHAIFNPFKIVQQINYIKAFGYTNKKEKDRFYLSFVNRKNLYKNIVQSENIKNFNFLAYEKV